MDSTPQWFVVVAKKQNCPPLLHTQAYTPNRILFFIKNVSAVGTHIQSEANEITASCCDTDGKVSWEPILEAERHSYFSFSSLLCSCIQQLVVCVCVFFSAMWAADKPEQMRVFCVVRIGNNWRRDGMQRKVIKKSTLWRHFNV